MTSSNLLPQLLTLIVMTKRTYRPRTIQSEDLSNVTSKVGTNMFWEILNNESVARDQSHLNTTEAKLKLVEHVEKMVKVTAIKEKLVVANNSKKR